MHCTRIAPLPAWWMIAGLLIPFALASAGEIPDRPHDASRTIARLEAALPRATAEERPALLDNLGTAYEAALKKADAEGRKDDVELYRDNLEILRRKRQATKQEKPAPVAAAPQIAVVKSPGSPSVDAPERPADEKEVVNAMVLPRGELPQAGPLPEPEALPAAPEVKSLVLQKTPLKAPAVKGSPERPAVTRPDLKESLKAADTAFLSARYEEAGKIYSRLAGKEMLPKDRRSHWAYCRAVSVVNRINDRPASSADWASIDTEIQAIQALSPGNWYAEYLRNLASERSRKGGSPKARVNSRVVVRGSSPDDTPRKNDNISSSHAPDSSRAAETIKLPGSNSNWSSKPVVSTNFHVHHMGNDPALAQQVSEAAERCRALQLKKWGVAASAGGSWTPRCEILLYPGSEEFGKDTKQPADSPGFSSMGMNAGRIVFRRIHLRVNHPNLVKAILPHEVTHVVLADMFPDKQIPRWADEGLAVLAEPSSEQAVRAADLEEPLKVGKLFRLGDLMGMDYPDPKHWSLYYAQSVSLTRFLVNEGTPAQFITFVKHAQNEGFEPALQSVYEIASYSDLHKRWLVFAKECAAGSASLTATNREANSTAETRTR